ncbi:DUF2381 family protein [Corallococcus sp. M34]|uniref:DUF2381 family protein n=1 Tax=Citreicoccus inhibens TaxID=2849499 RepID=UPI001C242A86|nr:DUF2381 family protein [Citreicoccus inhibens]MBU8895037.1 DUF2381 family protein [Citreicoccus inhibens]
MRFRCLIAFAVLLGYRVEAAAPPVSQDASVRRIELTSGSGGSTPEVVIGPGLSTTFLFDSDIQSERLDLEGRERFARLMGGASHVVVLPSADLRPGERLRFSVAYRDGAAPARATFLLRAAEPGQPVDRQVEVNRRPRTVESYRAEVARLEAQVESLRTELRQSQGAAPAVCERPAPAAVEETGPLTELLKRTRVGPLSLSRVTQHAVVCRGACTAQVFSVTRYLMPPHLALRLIVETQGSERWATGRPVLLDRRGREVKLRSQWNAGVDAPPRFTSLLVEGQVEDGTLEDFSRFTLKLSDADGGGQASFEMVFSS